MMTETINLSDFRLEKLNDNPFGTVFRVMNDEDIHKLKFTEYDWADYISNGSSIIELQNWRMINVSHGESDIPILLATRSDDGTPYIPAPISTVAPDLTQAQTFFSSRYDLTGQGYGEPSQKQLEFLVNKIASFEDGLRCGWPTFVISSSLC